MIPAAGQGILAVQGRKEFLKDTVWRQYVDDKKSRVQALAERSFIRVLDGGCTSPSAAYAKVKGNELELTGLYYRLEESSAALAAGGDGAVGFRCA